MQELKQELEKVGSNLNSPEQDPMSFSGIRRLRLLYSNSHKTPHSPAHLSRESTHKDATSRKSTTPNSQSPLKAVLVTSDGFISGMSQTASIAVVIGSVIGLLLISYLIYKYFTWKPKLIARRGYRAVAKSKGISAMDDVVEAKGNGDVLRASASGDIPSTDPPKN